VAHLPDGRVIFIHDTAPGDRATVQVVKSGKRWARGRLVRVIEPSPQRREPPCTFHGRCGGCPLEHLQYDAQLEAKGRIVADAIRRIGGIECEVPEVVAAPSEFRYRNRVSFSLRREAAGRIVAGFHALGDPDVLVDVDGECLLPEQPISDVWDQLRANWGADANLLPSGDTLRLTLRATSTGEVSLLVEGGYSAGRPEELIERVQGLSAIWHRPRSSVPDLIGGSAGMPESWGDEIIEVSGAAFLQVNRGAAALLEKHVLNAVGDANGLRIVDAYCGVGLHARRLARMGASVVGIELDADAIAAAASDAPAGARFLTGSVEALLPAELPADLVILNPPRPGVAAEVTDALNAAPPERILYISCDPATLARDLKRLSPAFELAGIRCFDLFPQTAHVETVADLRRSSVARSTED
jgi:23S rRNA (uracil1939-C5)-methyltransferase